MIIYFILDVDECIDQTYNCDVNAFCNNTVGSFNCTCVSGYSGNGTTCVGEYQFLFFFSHKRVAWQGLPLQSSWRLPQTRGYYAELGEAGGGGYSEFSTNLVPRTFTGKRPRDPGDKVGFIVTRSRDLTRVFCGIVLVQF